MKKLDQYLEQLECYVQDYSTHSPKVSVATVGWQIGHALKVIISVCKALEQSDPSVYKWKINFKRSLILMIGRFPRGRAKSPKFTRPASNIAPPALEELFVQAREAISRTENLSSQAWFTHPIFGDLSLSQTKQFLTLHTKHHLLIIRDIMD